MADAPQQRSVKISDDERTGWSSDRPRRGPARPSDVGVRCRVLSPTHELRYSPGSLLMVASASAPDRDNFAERLIHDRSSVLSLRRVRDLIAGRVPAEDVESRAAELMDAAVGKRLAAGETTVVVVDGLDPDEREHYVRMAAPHRRPRHLILVEASRADVADDQRAALNELRRRLDAGELGSEGFHSALRLSGQSLSEVRRVVFRPPPRDD